MNNGGEDSTKELTEKLKKTMKSPDWPNTVVQDVERRYGLQLHADLMQQLGKTNTNLMSRITAIRRLTLAVKDKFVKEDEAEKLWLALEDLLDPSAPEDSRNAALALLTAVAVSGNTTKRFGAPMRHIMLNYVQKTYQTLATEPLFELFTAAVGNGKSLELVEDLIGPFFNSWYSMLLKSKKAADAITLFVNLTKTNAAFLDEPELLGLVKQTVVHMNTTQQEQEGMLCLTAIETVVAYCHLPSVMIKAVVASLARIVSLPSQFQRSWKLMRTILGTYLGVSALFTICDLIKCQECRDPHITRGCVYFLHTALWGVSPVTSLDVPFPFALPVLLEASLNHNELVVYEVAFAIKLLVGKLGAEIHPQAWEIIFSIVTNLYNFCLSLDDSVKGQAILNVVNDAVDYMESLKEQDQFCVRRETFFNFLRPYTNLRSEASATEVVQFLAKDALDSCKEDGAWLERLSTVLLQHYCRDHRVNIRKLATTWMVYSVKNLGKKHANQVVVSIILPALAQYRQEPLPVRCAVVDVLGTVAYGHNHPVMTECLQLLIQTLTEPFKKLHGSTPVSVASLRQSSTVDLPHQRDPSNPPHQTNEVTVTSDSATSTLSHSHIADADHSCGEHGMESLHSDGIDRSRCSDGNSRSNFDVSAYEDGKSDSYCDVIMAVDWLIKIFKRRIWHLPSSDAILAFKALLTFLDNHYTNPGLFNHLPQIRSKILGLIFLIRANERFEIGLPEVEDAQLGHCLPSISLLDASILPRFTPYIIIDHKHGHKLASASYISMSDSGGSDSDISSTDVRAKVNADRAIDLSSEASVEGKGHTSTSLSVEKAVRRSGQDDREISLALSKTNETDEHHKSPHRLDSSDPTKSDSLNDTPKLYGVLNDSIQTSSLKDISFLSHVNADVVKKDSSLNVSGSSRSVGHSGPAPSLEPNTAVGSSDQSTKNPKSEGAKGDVSLNELLLMFNQLGMKGPDGKLIIPSLPETDDPWKEAQRLAPITYLSLTEAAASVIVAMKREKDWALLKLILEGIPKMLQNKALIVSRDSNDIDYFAEALTGMITDRSLNLPASLYNTPEKFLRPHFENYVYVALSCLSCYKRQLSQKWQNAMVSCLTNGMMNKYGGVCIVALTLCCLEMPHTMVKSLPSILHSLTKISATVHSSQPVLEFLSTLLHLPHIYCNFSADQYMAVFAIVIPYTNPIKFNQYVVILAFHVLAMWFLKCKISSRRNFVNFITKNLKNVLGPEDAVPRRRSASLHDQPQLDRYTPAKAWMRSQAAKRCKSLDAASVAETSYADPPAPDAATADPPLCCVMFPAVPPERLEVFVTLHRDMCRTLTDLMSRYAFASCTPMARRSEVGEALVGCGQQQTWLVGLKLFTITTSGCSHRPMTSTGLCENCHAHCEDLLDPRTSESGLPLNATEDGENCGSTAASARAGQKGGALGHDATDIPDHIALSVHEEASSQSQGGIESLTVGGGQQALRDHHLCTCWCIGYAEVYVRQPTGNMVWMMRLQNHQQILEEGKQLSMDDLCSLYGPSITPKPSHRQQVLEPALELSPGVPPSQFQRSVRRGSDTNLTNFSSALVTAGQHRGTPVAHYRALSGDGKLAVEDNSSSAAAVQRSCSSPEITDNKVPPNRARTLTENAPVPGATPELDSCTSSIIVAGGGAASSSPNAAPIKAHASVSVTASVSGGTATVTTKACDGPITARMTPPNKEIACPLSRLAAASASHKPLDLSVSPRSPTEDGAYCPSSPLGTSTPGSRTSPNTGPSQPTVPQSPSRFLSRFSKINTNFNKFFSSTSSGVTSPTSVAPPGDVKRLRHSSALSTGSTSTSQPNVSSLVGVTASNNQPPPSQEKDCDVLAPIRRGRGHTISVMNPASRPPPTVGTPLSPLSSPPHSTFPTQPKLEELFSKPWSRPQPGTTTHDPRAAARSKDTRGGVTPSNVLLQLLYSGSVEKSFERPLLLPSEETFQRTVKVLDMTPPLENHCLGVLYVGYGQTTEQQVLSNTVGSARYQSFLSGLGTVVSIKKASKDFFLPGLSDKGDDGDECYVWHDEIMQVSFHVATLMPNKPNDPKFTSKKRHIGNDFVTIVYNDSGKPYDRDIIKTQFNTVIVEIRPAEHGTNTVHMILKPNIRELLSATQVVRLVSDTNLALYVRQMALHSVIACRVEQQLKLPEPYAGNWLCRLRMLYKLRDRLQERLKDTEDDETTDFTDMLGPR
ncbi:Tuberin-type domain [Trinorchestia longiramus]|nr:Tuberin-type domain [Trinorchestia longiramus]